MGWREFGRPVEVASLSRPEVDGSRPRSSSTAVGVQGPSRYGGPMDQQQRPIVRVLEGGGEQGVDGTAVLNEIFDLLRRRLPLIPLDDPVRPHLAALTPLLGAQLRRPQALAVREAGQRQSG